MKSSVHILLCLLILLGTTTGFAQVKDSTLSGVVTDYFGAVIPDVGIEAKNTSGRVYFTKTGYDGVYKFVIPSGRYSLAFKAKPFDNFYIADYQVVYAGKMSLDVSLICDSGCSEVTHLVGSN